MHLREGWVPTGKLYRRDRPKPSISIRETRFTISIWPKQSNIKCPIFIEDTVRLKRTVSTIRNGVFGVILAVLEVRRSPKLAVFGVSDRIEGPKSWHGVFNKDAARVSRCQASLFPKKTVSHTRPRPKGPKIAQNPQILLISRGNHA